MTIRDLTRTPLLNWHHAARSGCLLLLLVAIIACTNARNDRGAPGVVTVGSKLTSDPAIQQILVTSCFDCHSNEADGGWSARLAPSYLFGLDKAREVLNFSQWSVYPVQRRREELVAIEKVVGDGSMPPGDYDFFHPGAKLGASQRRSLLQWASSATVAAH